ncbi:DUF6970 domain-containing protein [Hymenobacter chitinivorans]|uniref:DUF6970 domain-containing protein n=1 Tax=Hymenobacter chitinivorans DSM 11115 TaxID=1121954 RepID=A0A2M9B9F8_9BACT|nr:hypothetical protein [Hymenobacter chitinivorans]PJJ54591.1 hypothetical protein CLV45_2932 [Hymenobacter chitinivorans DSM 11115]
MKALLFLVSVWGCLGMVQCQKDAVAPDAETAPDTASACVDSRAQPLIDELLRTPKANPAGEVWRYTWEGRPVFLVKSFRPDDYQKVYEVTNAQLQYVGAPSGGITGKGDGKCPTFSAQATNGCLVWRDSR